MLQFVAPELKNSNLMIRGHSWTAIAVPFLMFAGVSGYLYAEGSCIVAALLLYVASLAIAVLILTRVRWRATPAHKVQARNQKTGQGSVNTPGSVLEDTGLTQPAVRSKAYMDEPNAITPGMTQQEFDFDGIEALRNLDEITGGWLVLNASERVAGLIRKACIEQLEGGDADIARVERWLDISDCLKSAECRSLAKAESRRAFVAERCGVSKEQVRQIDQGRYAPLNKVLKGLVPRELAGGV